MKVLWFFYNIYTGWMFFLFLVLMLGPTILPFLLFGEKLGGRIAYFFLKIWAHGFALWGMGFRARNRRGLKREQAVIYIANHSSFIDSPATVAAIPGQFRPLGKVEIAKVPLFGWIYRHIVILIDRNSRKGRVLAYREMQKILNLNIPVLIYPEGTMNRSGAVLNPFQEGAFRLAVEMQCDLVPIAIRGTRQMLEGWHGGKPRPRPGKATLTFLPRISVQGKTLEDIANLKEESYQRLYAELAQDQQVVAE